MQLEAPPAAESEPTDSTVKDVISQVVSEVAQQYDQHAAVSEEAAHQGATATAHEEAVPDTVADQLEGPESARQEPATAGQQPDIDSRTVSPSPEGNEAAVPADGQDAVAVESAAGAGAMEVCE